MRHHRYSIRFGRQRSHYNATLRLLLSGLILNKSIRTTKAKAKESSRLADKLVTLGKDKSVANQRKAYSILCDRKLVKILFDEIAPLFKDRKGGYTRVILLGNRRGDNAQAAILEFIEKPKPPEVREKKEKKEKKMAPPVEETKMEKKPPLEFVPRLRSGQAQGREKKEEPKKEIPVRKEEPKKPEKPIPKPGFFKRFFGRKADK